MFDKQASNMDQTVSVNLFNYILIIGQNELFMNPLFLVSWVKKPLGNPNPQAKEVHVEQRPPSPHCSALVRFQVYVVTKFSVKMHLQVSQHLLDVWHSQLNLFGFLLQGFLKTTHTHTHIWITRLDVEKFNVYIQENTSTPQQPPQKQTRSLNRITKWRKFWESEAQSSSLSGPSRPPASLASPPGCDW